MKIKKILNPFTGAAFAAILALVAFLTVAMPLSDNSRLAEPSIAPDTTITPNSLPDLPEPDNKQITILFGGDVMLSRAVGAKMAREQDYLWPWRSIASTTRSADIAFANLESVISDKGRNIGSTYSFRADPRSIEGLQYAGFDVMSVANNHAADWGAAAFSDSLTRLAQADIAYTGGGFSEQEAYGGIIVERAGYRIGFLGYTDLIPASFSARGNNPGVARIDRDRIQAAIAALEPQTDYIVVTYHWGEEYRQKSNQNQQSLARFTIDAGADFVIGHHPHVTQEIEEYNGGLIVYSLGNLIFDQHFSNETWHSMLLEIEVNGQGMEYRTIPIEITHDYQIRQIP